MDNRTLGIALMTVAMAIASLGILLARGRRDRALTLWSWAFISIVPGFGLLSLQGTVTPWLSIILANTLALGFHFLMAAGMRGYTGKRNPWPFRFWLYFLTWQIFILFFTFIRDSYLARAVGASLMIILLTGEFLVLCGEKACLNLPPYAKRFIEGSLLVFCAGHGVRIAALFLLPGSNLLGDHRVTTYYFMFNLAYTIIWPGLIWLLDSHRLLHQQASLNRVKDRIWKMAGHDLRGPLGTLEQYLEVLSQPGGGEECIEREDIFLMKTSVREVNNLLENILDLARTDTSTPQSKVPCDLEATVQNVCSTWSAAARLKGIRFITTMETGLSIESSPEALQGALRNLVSNGVKFSPPGSELEITGRKDGNWIVLTVRDHGPGMDPGQLAAFTQEETPLPRRRGTANEGGSGFGLTLVKELVSTLNGRLEARNHPEGGAEFTLKLPSP